MVGSFVFTSIVKERYIRTPRGKENNIRSSRMITNE